MCKIIEPLHSEFGSGWADDDKDCQNTRQDLLIAMSTSPVHYADGKECRVVRGRWISMHSNKILVDASTVDIHHVVPPKWAWGHGASDWSRAKRIKFANDPANLVTVDASLNRAKGAKGLNEWLPPQNATQYRARFRRVAIEYGLRVD